MRFTEYEFEKSGFYKRTKLYGILSDFADSGIECARVEDWDYKDASIGAGSMNSSIKHYKIGGIKAFSRSGEIYLVNENAIARRKSDKGDKKTV